MTIQYKKGDAVDVWWGSSKVSEKWWKGGCIERTTPTAVYVTFTMYGKLWNKPRKFLVTNVR
jgi:hypothetical protein